MIRTHNFMYIQLYANGALCKYSFMQIQLHANRALCIYSFMQIELYANRALCKYSFMHLRCHLFSRPLQLLGSGVGEEREREFRQL